jgi:hypothetical protein
MSGGNATKQKLPTHYRIRRRVRTFTFAGTRAATNLSLFLFVSIWNPPDYSSMTMSPSSFATTLPQQDGDQVIIEVIDHLSDGKVMALSLLFIFSGTLSILGSSTIVYKVVKNRSKTTPYDRLMLGLSSCDIVASVSWILTPFLLPEETSPRVWARGTDTTCTILGTISQLGYAAIFYNLILSVYYLLTVRFGVKKEVFARRYEPVMHIFGLSYFIGTAGVGAVFGVYSEVDIGLGCWVNDFPKGCEADPKTCISDTIAWAFGAGPLLITVIALFTNNLIIYFHVKNKLGPNNNNNNNLKPEGLTSEQARQLPTQQQLDRTQQLQRHVHEVATQGFLYVITFFCAYTPFLILRAIEAYAARPISESPIFPLLVLNSVFFPLQGFFNMFVYNRPNYTRIRMAYPELSTLWAIQKACLDPDIPRLTEATRLSLSRSRLSGAGSHYRGTGGGGGDKSSSGRAFSSDLDVLQEASQEESLGDEEEEGLGTVAQYDFKSRELRNDNNDEPAKNAGNAMSTDSSEFDLEKEYGKIFQHNNITNASSSSSPPPPKDTHHSCLRISYDGSVR